MRVRPGFAWLLSALLGIGGCAPDRPPAPAADPDPVEGVLPQHGPDPVLPDPGPQAGEQVPAPPALQTILADTVVGWTGPDGAPLEVTLRTAGEASALHRQIGRRSFALPLRTSGLGLAHQPCSSCHQGVTIRADRAADAHRDIEAIHPAEREGTCAGCHVPARVERLSLEGGETVSLDHAYRLCARCHFSQVRDWAAGAHGKRLVGWTGRRVVMNCADCHDPHRPAAERRIPYPGPRIPREAASQR